MRWAQARDSHVLALRTASVPEKIRAYKKLEKQILKEAKTALERKEMQRRITEDLLMATMSGPWRGFSPYLRRMERLGYSSMDCRLLVCSWAAQAAKGSSAGVHKASALIADFERRARGKTLHPGLREQIDTVLANARRFLGLKETGSPRAGPAPTP